MTILADNRARTLAATDELPGPQRELVHEFGFEIVRAFRDAGIKEPRIVRHLVLTCWDGPRSMSETTRKHAPQSRIMQRLDWLLINARASITAETLVRVLWHSNVALIPMSPSEVMVDASIAATADMGLVSKYEKHRGRLRAALVAQARSTFPHLFDNTK